VAAHEITPRRADRVLIDDVVVYQNGATTVTRGVGITGQWFAHGSRGTTATIWVVTSPLGNRCPFRTRRAAVEYADQVARFAAAQRRA
jgi:hypothetical protein